MSGSILLDTKKILGINESYTAFDPDVIMHINSALAILAQLGVGPSNGIMIYDETTTWDEIVGSSRLLNMVKSYVYLRVRMLFDPPGTSFVLKAFEDQLRELEWRISIHRESEDWTTPRLPLVTVIDGGHP